jgi:hypothetical protein
MSEYIPENPFGVGIVENDSEHFLRKLRASVASAMVGLTTAYVGSKAGGEIVTDPVTILTESLAIYHAAGAAQIAERASHNYVLGLFRQDNS